MNKGKISNPLDPTKPPEKGGSTWSTFYGLLGLLDALGQDRPDWLVIENVDELVTSRDEEVIDVLLAELAARGFECFFMLMNSYDWAVAQSRRRVFVVGVSCIQPKAFTFDGEFDLEEMFEDLKNLIASARMQADCLTRALLPNDHPLVEAALAQWVERDVKGWDSNTLKTHMNFWGNKGLRLGEKSVTERTKASPWYRYLNDRDKDALVAHQHLRRK